MKPKILVVDDEKSHRRMLEAVLTDENYQVHLAESGKTAIEAVEGGFFDLILMDIRMSHVGGIEALKTIKKLSPGIPVIMMTAYASVNTAVDALKAGAYDYLTKPLNIDELKLLVEKAIRHHYLEQENLQLKEQLGTRFDFANIVGKSPAMRHLFESVALVAPTEATVLIEGESGTGKELIANAIHLNSPRREKPLVKVNCAALTETLLESELFGHEKGAFTGAESKRKGRFQLSDKGTIFLDEIAEMSLSTQTKILRVLQEQEFEPVGSSQTVKVDLRVIAATNRQLEIEMQQKRFREDLYYRLNVVILTVPPLRERKEDIPLLVDLFLQTYAEKNRRFFKGCSPRAMDILMRHDWPGNVRELENVIERAVILGRGDRITPSEFPEALRDGEESQKPSDGVKVRPGRSLKEVEKEMILRTLDETEGNRTRAAKILGISRRTLQLKLKEYGIQ